MELGALVSETFLASTKGAKVFNCFRADLIVQDEVNSAFLFCSGESQHTRAFFFFLCLLFICAGLEKGGGRSGRTERESERDRESEKKGSLASEWLIRFSFDQNNVQKRVWLLQGTMTDITRTRRWGVTHV